MLKVDIMSIEEWLADKPHCEDKLARKKAAKKYKAEVILPALGQAARICEHKI